MRVKGKTPATDNLSTLLSWFCLFALLGAIAWLRFGLLDVPLERDEGEFAYGGQLLLQGIPPFQYLYNMKLPGIYVIYAGMMHLFGQDIRGIHLGLLIVNGFSVFLVFLIGRRFFNPFAALAAAAAFALFSVGQSVQGVFANAEHFVVLFALCGVFLLLEAVNREKLWLYCAAGLMLGTGILMKQHGLFFAVWAVLYLGVKLMVARESSRSFGRQVTDVMALCLFIALPYGLVCLWLLKVGVFAKFWLWTIEYARAYTSQISLREALNLFRTNAGWLVKDSPLLWLFSGLGVFCCLLEFYSKRSAFILSFFCFSFLAICPGFYFRPHYFVLVLPAAALLFGSMVAFLSDSLLHKLSVSVKYGVLIVAVGVCLGSSLYRQRQFLLEFSPAEAVQSTYWPNPFVESLAIADYIRKNSETGDKVAIIGSEPQIYFYSQRRSASGYIYMYPLMERHDLALTMQRELIRDVEAVKPEYLVFVRIAYSWLQRPDSHTLVFEWFPQYKKGYERVGLVEIFDKSSRYYWGSDALRSPLSPYWIEILHKKDQG